MFRWRIGDGIELRILSVEDARELFALVDRNRRRLGEYLPWVHQTHAPPDVEAFLLGATEQHEAGRGFHGGIVSDGRLVGCAGMHPINLEHRHVSLGYWIDESAQGRGLVTRATAELVRISFEEYRLRRVEIQCAVGNERSRKVPLRLGFREEGVLRSAQIVNGRWLDLQIFGRLHDDASSP